MPNSIDQKIALVTGANQGLGFALVRGLCRALGDRGHVYLTARDENRGRAACKALQDEGFRPKFHLLDVADVDSVQRLSDTIRLRHGGIDIVISNAAARIAKDVPPAEQVVRFIDTNNHGTVRVIRAFSSLLRNDARFIVVASSFGSLRHLHHSLHHKFNVETLSLDDVERVMGEYAQAVRSGAAGESQWPEWINIPSKIGQVAATKIFARMGDADFHRRGILVNAVCPGLVDTEASRPWFDDMTGAASPDEAARDIVWLATLPPSASEPHGQLIQHRRLLPWV